LPDAGLRELADRVTVPMVALGASQRSAAFDVARSAGDVGIALARAAADSASARRRRSRDITACL
jgi:hypothetical protein